MSDAEQAIAEYNALSPLQRAYWQVAPIQRARARRGLSGRRDIVKRPANAGRR